MGEVDAIEERWSTSVLIIGWAKLSSVNAPDFSICDTGVSDSSPLSLPVPGRFLPDLDRGRKPRSFFLLPIGWCGQRGTRKPEVSNIELRGGNRKGILLR
jgi:hypothetical protein